MFNKNLSIINFQCIHPWKRSNDPYYTHFVTREAIRYVNLPNVTSALNPTHEWMKRPIVLKMLANAGRRASEVGKEVGNKNVKGTAFNMKYLREPPSSTNADKNKKSGRRWNERSGDKRKGRKMIFSFHGFYFSISLNNVWKVIFLKWAIYRNSFPFQVVSAMNLIFRFEKHLLLRRRCSRHCAGQPDERWMRNLSTREPNNFAWAHLFNRLGLSTFHFSSCVSVPVVIFNTQQHVYLSVLSLAPFAVCYSDML